MRRTVLTTLLVTICASTARASDPAPSPEPPKPVANVVYLNRLALGDLEKSNPEHYARAQKILAQASEVCQPGAQKQLTVKLDDLFHCSGMLLKTSYPAKREVRFTLDNTYYVALVTVTGDAARIVPVQ